MQARFYVYRHNTVAQQAGKTWGSCRVFYCPLDFGARTSGFRNNPFCALFADSVICFTLYETAITEELIDNQYVAMCGRESTSWTATRQNDMLSVLFVACGIAFTSETARAIIFPLRQSQLLLLHPYFYIVL